MIFQILDGTYFWKLGFAFPKNLMRNRPSAVDQILAVLSVVLIIGMIQCFIFYLVTVLYRGEFSIRLMYILGLYTFASVLIARISIEQSRALASSYTTALGLATLFVLLRFVTFQGSAVFSVLLAAGFLATVGYLADRITHDCTFLDEQVDTSGKGLLQSLGLVATTIQESKSKKHNPGMWVLYFSVVVIPLFGMTSMFGSESSEWNANQRFLFVVGFYAFTLSLLATTNLLGLRRYWRQRGVDMPMSMLVTWLSMGMVMVILFLFAGWLLPLPGRSGGLYPIPALWTSRDAITASRYGWGKESAQRTDPEQASGAPSKTDSESSDAQQTSHESSPSRTPSDDGKTSTSSSQDAKGSEEASRPSQNAQSNPPQQNKDADASKQSPSSHEQDPKSDETTNGGNPKPQNASNSSQPSQASSPQNSSWQWTSPNSTIRIGPFIKWLTLLALAIIVAIGLYRYRADFMNWLRGQNKKGISPQTDHKAETSHQAIRSFDDYRNPFTGNLQALKPLEIVRYTFEALEAWSLEQHQARLSHETPSEFLTRIAEHHRPMKAELSWLNAHYELIAYANKRPTQLDFARLQLLWHYMEQHRRTLNVQAG